MKERIASIVSFLGGFGCILLSIVGVISDFEHIDTVAFLGVFGLTVSGVATILYVVWTRFGKIKFSELEKIDYENQLLERKIKQKELKKKLEE
jgi:hypothetical protein